MTLQLNCSPANFGKKTLVDVVCNELHIPTCGKSTGKKRSRDEVDDEQKTWLPYLQKLNTWGKSVSALPADIDIQDVKRFLIGSGLNCKEVKKYKTLCSWEHKQGVHSLTKGGPVDWPLLLQERQITIILLMKSFDDIWLLCNNYISLLPMGYFPCFVPLFKACFHILLVSVWRHL